jgi:hypothetical protein
MCRPMRWRQITEALLGINSILAAAAATAAAPTSSSRRALPCPHRKAALSAALQGACNKLRSCCCCCCCCCQSLHPPHLKPPGPLPGVQGVYSKLRSGPAWSMPTITKGGSLPTAMRCAAVSAAFHEVPDSVGQSPKRFWPSLRYTTG